MCIMALTLPRRKKTPKSEFAEKQRRLREFRRRWFKHLLVERLEDRIAPTVTSDVTGGKLTVTSNAADAISITTASGNVKINGGDPGTGAAASSSITSIEVKGGPGANIIDLSGVLVADFTAPLTGVTIEGKGGDD